MTTDYNDLAAELLSINEALEALPARTLLHKFSHGEHFVLNYLAAHAQGARPVDLSRGLLVSTARIAALLRRMENKGLIQRRPDPTNNRQVLVFPSPEGLEAMRQFRAQVLSATAGMLRALGPEDAAELVRLEKKLLGHLSPANAYHSISHRGDPREPHRKF